MVAYVSEPSGASAVSFCVGVASPLLGLFLSTVSAVLLSPVYGGRTFTYSKGMD